jgi:magnesium chelatase family protein
VLDALRQPLAAGEVVIVRQARITRFPAEFTLVLTADPCPCASADGNCTCPPAARRRHTGRMPGQLLVRTIMSNRGPPISNPRGLPRSVTVSLIGEREIRRRRFRCSLLTIAGHAWRGGLCHRRMAGGRRTAFSATSTAYG